MKILQTLQGFLCQIALDSSGGREEKQIHQDLPQQISTLDQQRQVRTENLRNSQKRLSPRQRKFEVLDPRPTLIIFLILLSVKLVLDVRILHANIERRNEKYGYREG